MKTTILYFVLAFLAFSTSAQKQEYSFKETFPTSSTPKFILSNSDGTIDVFPGKSNEIEVYFIVKKDNVLMKLSRKELESELTVSIQSSQDLVSITVQPKSTVWIGNWKERIYVAFEVYVPKQTTTDIHCSDGNVQVAGLNANQVIKSSDGNVHLLDIVGNVNARTSDGNVIAKNITGDAELLTSDGNVELDMMTGNISGRTSDGNIKSTNSNGKIQMTTSDGNIRIDEAKGDLILTTSDGDIRIINASGKMELKTSDGSINFENVSGAMTGNTADGQISGSFLAISGPIVLSTVDGPIDIAIPASLAVNLLLKGSDINTDLKNFSGTAEDEIIDGKLNGGGVAVKLTAVDGSISLKYL